MTNQETVIQAIYAAFGQNEYPGDHLLQGSFEGCEPGEAVAPFVGLTRWQDIGPELLDRCYTALSFFSEAGLRFFLPAYLAADVREQLQTAEPLFVLIHGFSQVEFQHQTPAGLFVRLSGYNVLMNPRRYGAMTFYDYARWRLSIFTREEAQTIVAYLHYKRETDPYHLHTAAIEAALSRYWLERAAQAPTAAELRRRLQEEAAYLAAISAR